MSKAKHSELLAEFEISSEAVKRGIPSLDSSNAGEDFLDIHASLCMHFVAGLMPQDPTLTLFLLVRRTRDYIL